MHDCDSCGKECHWSELSPLTALGQTGSFCSHCVIETADAIETLIRWAQESYDNHADELADQDR